ncbi:MAG: hypothetical protein GX220_05865 [Treponema sp.]|nr:hypothetical protein [Treponema sp.]
MNNKLKYIFIILFFTFASYLFCNPFLGNSSKKLETNNIEQDTENETVKNNTTPTPVRSSKQRESLIKKQKILREKLGKFFFDLKNSSDKTHNQKIIWNILLASFLYGIFHAAGPGHRKTIVFSMYLTRKSKIWEPAVTGLALAFLHGGTAIFLMMLFSGISSSISAKTNNVAIYLEGFSYLLIIVTAVVLLIHEIISFIKYQNSSSVCTNENSQNKIGYISFLISGCYPCPGAILVLVLSFTLKILKIGIASVLAMSLGMSIPIIFSAYLAWFGKTGIFKILKQNEKQASITAFILSCFGYVLLIGFSLYIALPFFLNLHF